MEEAEFRPCAIFVGKWFNRCGAISTILTAASCSPPLNVAAVGIPSEHTHPCNLYNSLQNNWNQHRPKRLQAHANLGSRVTPPGITAVFHQNSWLREQPAAGRLAERNAQHHFLKVSAENIWMTILMPSFKFCRVVGNGC